MKREHTGGIYYVSGENLKGGKNTGEGNKCGIFWYLTTFVLCSSNLSGWIRLCFAWGAALSERYFFLSFKNMNKLIKWFKHAFLLIFHFYCIQ